MQRLVFMSIQGGSRFKHKQKLDKNIDEIAKGKKDKMWLNNLVFACAVCIENGMIFVDTQVFTCA